MYCYFKGINKHITVFSVIGRTHINKSFLRSSIIFESVKQSWNQKRTVGFYIHSRDVYWILIRPQALPTRNTELRYPFKVARYITKDNSRILVFYNSQNLLQRKLEVTFKKGITFAFWICIWMRLYKQLYFCINQKF